MTLEMGGDRRCKIMFARGAQGSPPAGRAAPSRSHVRPRRRTRREREREGRTGAGHTLDPDTSAVRLDEPPCDGEAEAVAGVLRVPAAEPALEQVRLIL